MRNITEFFQEGPQGFAQKIENTLKKKTTGTFQEGGGRIRDS